MRSFYQSFSRSIAIGLLSAIGVISLNAKPLFAQADLAEDPADKISPFCKAVAAQSPWATTLDVEHLSEAILQGGDLNQLCDFYGEQVLPLNFWLATDDAIAQQLIEMGADVNARDGKGNTPLHAAGDSVEIVRSLIERGANVNARNEAGLTPLHNVSGRKSAAVMALLIEPGADVNAVTTEGMTPLHFASFSPKSEIAALLISKGADVNARTGANFTPLHYVSSRPDVAALLLQAGADPTIQNNEGGAIHLSDISPEVLQLLLAAGVDVNARNQAGQTALHRQRFDAENAALLLAAGADVNVQDNQGKTPLFDVNINVAEQLVAAGADLNIQDELGRTPLHQAVIEERSFFGLELVPLLLGAGAIADIEDYQGETALDIARRLGKTNIAMLFPSDSATLVGAETTDSETTDAQQLINIQRQVEDLLQAARADSRSVKKAVSRLSQAAELTQTVSDVKSRDLLLRDIGLVLVELEALENAEAIAQAMNYETRDYRSGEKLRVQLERTLIEAYVRSERMPQARLIVENSPPNLRAVYWAKMAESLVAQNLLEEAVALVDLIADDSSEYNYQQQSVVREINRAYIGAGEFEAAQAFWQQQSSRLPAGEVSGLRESAVWAGWSGQLEKGREIVGQIPEDYRAGALLELAQLYHYQNQPEQAKSLLDEARQLFDNKTWSGHYLQDKFETINQLAIAYADIGDSETARQVLTAAEQEASELPGGVYSNSDWVGAFANIGAFDRAMALLSTTSAGQRHEARLSISSVYVDSGQYDSAITLLSQISSSALFPYLEERKELFDRIVEESLEQEKINTAKRVAQVIENPLESAPVWVKIASFYQEKEQTDAAISVLDETLAKVLPLETLNSAADRNADYEVSNAGLLIAISKGYWAVGQTDQAVETAEAAIASTQNFQSDTQSRWYGNNDLETIIQLGRDWMVPELQSAALRELASRIEPVAPAELSSSNQYYQFLSLSRLAYDPNQPSSDLLDRTLARLEAVLAQTPDDRRLGVLHDMASLYSDVGRPEKARTAIEEILTLIAPFSAEQQRGHYPRLATIAFQHADLEASLQILPRVSDKQQIEVLTRLVQQSAIEDDTAQTIRYFEQLLEVSERSLSRGDRDSLLLELSQSYMGEYLDGFYYFSSLDTSAEVALMMRLPQHLSEPYQQAGLWTTLVLELPPTERAQAYEALSATLKEIPTSYNKRARLMFGIEAALNIQAFEQATQIAYGLDGEYCRMALSWIETVKEQSDRGS